MNKHYEWKQVRYGSEPGKGDNIFWSDATGLGNGDIIANLGTDNHLEARMLVAEHNAVVRELQARPAVPDVDELAQIIRRVDGGNMLGAGELAERIVAALTR